MIKKILEKIYYLFYSITLHSEKKFQALMLVTAGFTLFFLLIDSFLFLFEVKSILMNNSKIIIAGIFAFLAIFFHYYFKHNNRSDKIIEKYKNIEKEERNKIIGLVISIYGGLILLIILSGIIEG